MGSSKKNNNGYFRKTKKSRIRVILIRGRVEHNLVFIESFEEKELGVLRKALKFYEKKFYSSPGESDYTVISIYDEFKNAFPTGYLNKVINELILHHQVKTLVIVPSQNIQTQVANKLRKLIGSSNVSEKIPKQTNEEFLEEQKRVSESKANLMKEFL